MCALSLRLPEDLERRFEREAEAAGTSRSELAREAIAMLVDERERARFLGEIAEDAKRLRGAPEALAVADELLPLENEAMEVAEGPAPPSVDVDSEPWWE